MPDGNGETRRTRNERFGELSPEVRIPDRGAHIWDWFWQLSARRKSGPEALTFADVGDWSRLLLVDREGVNLPPSPGKTGSNLELLSDKLEVRKIYVRDASNITGSEQEANRAREEMRRDLVNAMVVRLQMLTPAQLDELQVKADERAKAEADALEAARSQQAETPQQSPLEVPGN